ncbi:MAG: hypothetical protein F6K09_07505 [Merismopedia sp. SIO2A8]|nr:hypothetical protein [Merismopedia sp. SIO2A8]
MTIRRILTTALLIGAGVVGTLSATGGIQAAFAQEQGQRSVAIQNGEGPFNRDGEAFADRRLKGSGPRGNRAARFCQEGGIEEHIDEMTGVLDELELTSTQEDNWDDVLNAVDDNEAALEEACASGDRTEIRAAFQEIRDPMQTFFSSLSDEQKEELREWRQERRNRGESINSQGRAGNQGDR